MASATGLGVAMVMFAWPCYCRWMGFECLWLGRFVADCAISVLAVVLVPLKVAISSLSHNFFQNPNGNDAPDDSVVVVQYSSSSHIGTRIFAPSFSRCIVIFHRHGSIIRGRGQHDVQRSTDDLGGRSEDKDVRGVQERANHRLV